MFPSPPALAPLPSSLAISEGAGQSAMTAVKRYCTEPASRATSEAQCCRSGFSLYDALLGHHWLYPTHRDGRGPETPEPVRHVIFTPLTRPSNWTLWMGDATLMMAEWTSRYWD